MAVGSVHINIFVPHNDFFIVLNSTQYAKYKKLGFLKGNKFGDRRVLISVPMPSIPFKVSK